MVMGATWTHAVGDDNRTLSMVLRDEPTVGLYLGAVLDLTGAQSVTVTITRLADRAQLQQGLATIDADPTTGQVSFITDETVATIPGFCEVLATVAWPSGEVRSQRPLYLLVDGRRPLAPVTQPPLDLGDDFVIQVTQWTPAGDPVVEVQKLGPDLVPTGDPTYLWDDPGDATNGLVAWPGDPNTLLDIQP